MSSDQGTIVLMGSGELTATMVELHKKLLRPFGPAAKAVFLDTPAGFQLNVDHISQKAADYFERRVQQKLRIASFKSVDDAEPDRERAFGTLRETDYVLIGPGSPSYAIEQWRQSPIPQILIRHVEKGGCLVAASAAALTTGRLTLPVYEIYKVGQPPHWIDGMDLLGHFGMNLAVFPHWNNAEGGNHDTRYCFMGEPRLLELEAMLPSSTRILGLDEHTALIIDLSRRQAEVQGVGRVTLRKAGEEWSFSKGDHVPLAFLAGEVSSGASVLTQGRDAAVTSDNERCKDSGGVWGALHGLADEIGAALEEGRDKRVAGGLLEMERLIWQARPQLDEEDGVGAARELFREQLASMGAHFIRRPADRKACLKPIVEALLTWRSRLRSEKRWDASDAIRHCLEQAGVIVEDTPQGAHWHVTD